MKPISFDLDRLRKMGRVVEEPKYDCEECKDRGLISGSGNTARRCECRSPRNNPEIQRQLLDAAGLGVREIASAIKPWDGEEPRWRRRWTEAALTQSMLGEPCEMLYIWSQQPGTGKTKLAAMCAADWVCAWLPGLVWVDVRTAIRRVMEARQDREAPRDTDRKIKEGQMVVFDDIRPMHADTGTRRECVEEWIYHVDRCGAPAIFTANHPPGELGLAAYSVSRLMGGLVVEVKGGDYRSRRRRWRGES